MINIVIYDQIFIDEFVKKKRIKIFLDRKCVFLSLNISIKKNKNFKNDSFLLFFMSRFFRFKLKNFDIVYEDLQIYKQQINYLMKICETIK